VERDREEIVRELAENAAEKVAGIVEAAERRAAEIEAEARREADRIVDAAKEEAKAQVERAQAAVSRLVEQADELRAAVGKLGSDLAPAGRAETTTPEPEIDPNPPRIPEPEPPREPEPAPPLTPEPQPPPTPEPQPPDVPEPQPPGPEVEGRPSTEELIEQLKGGAPTAEAGNGAAAPPPGEAPGSGGEADAAAARLVAMKMALDGSPRDEVDRHLADTFGPGDRAALLDDVFSRVGK
jgi:outer membrane biosynthesis protein TonB